MNKIKHVCQFCKQETIELSPEKLEQKCACGVKYTYRPNAGATYERKPKPEQERSA